MKVTNCKIKAGANSAGICPARLRPRQGRDQMLIPRKALKNMVLSDHDRSQVLQLNCVKLAVITFDNGQYFPWSTVGTAITV